MRRKIYVFYSLDLKTKLLLIEAMIFLAWARILIIFPFSRVAPLLGDHMQETSGILDRNNIKTLKNVHNAIDTMSKNTFWESKCLVRAIAGLNMLKRRGIESTLYLGTARAEDGSMIAHAWLRSGSYYITGAEGMEKFTVVGSFAKN